MTERRIDFTLENLTITGTAVFNDGVTPPVEPEPPIEPPIPPVEPPVDTTPPPEPEPPTPPVDADLELRVRAGNGNVIPAGYHVYVVPKGGEWHEGNTEEIRAADISVTFGDGGSKFENYHPKMALPNNANWMMGPHVSHTYETEGGTRTITATINRPNKPKLILTAQVTPIIKNDYDLDFAISKVGNFEGLGQGVERFTEETALQIRLQRLRGKGLNVRVKYHAGETYDLTYGHGLHTNDSIFMGRYGAVDKSFVWGNDPVLRVDMPSIGRNVWDGTHVLSMIGIPNSTFNNLRFLTDYNPVTGQLFEGKPVSIRTQGSNCRVVANKCQFIGQDIAVYLQSGSSFIANDCIVENPSNYGYFSQATFNEASIAFTGGWNTQHEDALSLDGKGLKQEFDMPDHGPSRVRSTAHICIGAHYARSMTGWFGKQVVKPSQPWHRNMLDDPEGEGMFKTVNIHNVVTNASIALQRQNRGKFIPRGMSVTIEALKMFTTPQSGGFATVEIGGFMARNCIFVRDDILDIKDIYPEIPKNKFQQWFVYGGFADGSSAEAKRGSIKLMNITAINNQGKDKNPAIFNGWYRNAWKDPNDPQASQLEAPIITNSILHAPHVPNAAEFADVGPLSDDGLYSSQTPNEGSFDEGSVAYRDFFGNVRAANSSKGATELAA